MSNPLRQLGNIPVTASVLESLFPHIKGGSQKLRLLECDKQIIRLKKGLYVCSPEITGKTLSTELIANHLYTPSYVSMSSALRYYGLIPEEVYTKQSMTLKCCSVRCLYDRVRARHSCSDGGWYGYVSACRQSTA